MSCTITYIVSIIQVQNLTKKFGDLTAVNNISFEVRQGEIFGMLGPNGAGKTTTLEIIEGIQEPTSGKTSVLGLNSQEQLNEVKEHIGVQLQASAYFDNLTLTEILDLFGSFYKKRTEPAKLLESVGLTEKKNALVKNLSGGQKQRFSISASLVNDPGIVFLDEPTTGLDPQARRHLWEYIRQISQQGKTIVLTTHYMEEAQRLCDRVAIIDVGKIVALDTPAKLISNLKSSYRINLKLLERVHADKFKQVQGVIEAREPAETEEPQIQLHVNKATETLPSLLSLIEREKIKLEDIEMQPANLEDVFLALTGKELRD